MGCDIRNLEFENGLRAQKIRPLRPKIKTACDGSMTLELIALISRLSCQAPEKVVNSGIHRSILLNPKIANVARLMVGVRRADIRVSAPESRYKLILQPACVPAA
jgi:hypothetical protein